MYENDKLRAVLENLLSERYFPIIYTEWRFINYARALEVYHRARKDRTEEPKAKFRKKKKQILQSVDKEHQFWLKEKLNYANEISLIQRLEDLAAEYRLNLKMFTRKEFDDFCREVKDWRNYLTHFGRKPNAKIEMYYDLGELNKKMAKIIKIHILLELGFDKEFINGKFPVRITDQHKLKYYLRFIDQKLPLESKEYLESLKISVETISKFELLSSNGLSENSPLKLTKEEAKNHIKKLLSIGFIEPNGQLDPSGKKYFFINRSVSKQVVEECLKELASQ